METLQSILAIASIFGITIVCEKLPIKFSPYTAIKKFLVGDIENKLNTLSDKFIHHLDSTTEKEKEDIRYKLLTYHKSIKNGIKLTEYDIMCINSLYDRYTFELKGNSYIKSVYREIMEMYKLQQERD